MQAEVNGDIRSSSLNMLGPSAIPSGDTMFAAEYVNPEFRDWR